MMFARAVVLVAATGCGPAVSAAGSAVADTLVQPLDQALSPRSGDPLDVMDHACVAGTVTTDGVFAHALGGASVVAQFDARDIVSGQTNDRGQFRVCSRAPATQVVLSFAAPDRVSRTEERRIADASLTSVDVSLASLVH
jgi:hypothetical protein